MLSDSGAGPLFRSLESHIVTQITQDTTEWKRPFGRTVKNVRVGVQFQQFDSALLENYKKGNWNILQQPVLHLYVTECNVSCLYTTNSLEIFLISHTYILGH